MPYIKNLLFLLAGMALGCWASAQPLIKVDNDESGKYIGDNAMVYQDNTKLLTLGDLRAQPGLWKPSAQNVINFGISGNYNWVEFRVLNQSQHNKLVLNLSYPIIDEVWFYVLHSDNSMDSVHISESAPVNTRAYKNQFYLFDIKLAKNDSATCYLKVYSPKQVLVPLTIGSAEQVLHGISNADLVSGIYYGIMLVMLLYNIFIFLTVRDKSYLYYVHYMFWVTITQATLQGYAHRFLWTDNVWLTHNMVHITGAMAGITTVLFTKSFLHTKANMPKLQWLLNAIIAGDLVALSLLFCGYPSASYNTINATAGIGSLIVIFCAARLFKKFRPAKFFLVSYSVFLVSVIIFVIKDLSVLPYNEFTAHSLQLGSAIEAMLLSFALADKINIFRKEKEVSQAQALEAQAQALEAQARELDAVTENERIVKEQNVMLEHEVDKRTHELQVSNEGLNKANGELSVAMKDLKEAQTQLVESEKMASLGQLTAGVAHEINNPINFVTSNVKPLNRDVHMLLDAISAMEEIVMEGTPIEERLQKIEDYKAEIDFDYLKEEIGQLLSGIGEGAARTAEIVKGLRIFSRLDEDDLKKADINEGMESTLIITNNLLNNVIKVEKKYGSLPMIECYPGKLNQVFLNIISNGIYAIRKKFGEKEGGWLTIATSYDDQYVIISIADNGTGMDEHTKKRLFEPFFTTKDVGEGTGLGLSIAYNTINKHNGQILVNSEIGKGTEFILKLPLIQK